MKIEFQRHDWSELQPPYATGVALGAALKELAGAADRTAAQNAYDSIVRILEPTQEKATSASIAAAGVLVNGLFGATTINRDLIVGLLSDMAAGFGEEDDALSDEYRAVMREVELGFTMYVHLLASDPGLDVRTAGTDLIFACGYRDGRFRSRARSSLAIARGMVETEELRELIDSSLDDLASG